jgi:hypothetical protein
LEKPASDNDDGRSDSDSIVGWSRREPDRTDGYQYDGKQHCRLPPSTVGKRTDDHAAERPKNVPDTESAQ